MGIASATYISCLIGDYFSGMAEKIVLLTGASGYVGGRLLPVLEAADCKVRCLARRPQALAARVGIDTEVVGGDVQDPDSLVEALAGVHTAYYMVHSMGDKQGFEDADRKAAENFSQAAERAGVRRIVYLGGLGDDDVSSQHLRSRHEVGRILRASSVETIEFRASIILGSGSLSFEMVRELVERLPVMVTPRWVHSLAQPIAIEDVIAYLREALDVQINHSRIVEIGGGSRVGYIEIMKEYARQRGLWRQIIPVPLLTPKLSSWWLRLITPLYARVGRKLVDSVCHDTVVTDTEGMRLFAVQPMDFGEAIARALHNEDRAFAATRWSDAFSAEGEEPNFAGLAFGLRRVDSRSVQLSCPAEAAFRPIARIGGQVGWYWGNPLWQLRGFLDLLLGGPGLRRGRRDPEHLCTGDAVDFWRVEAVEVDRLLRLRAQMKLPGRAWLQFEVEQMSGGCVLRQTAIFDPVGITGLLYWYGIYPLHSLVFAGMLRGIVRAIDGQKMQKI